VIAKAGGIEAVLATIAANLNQPDVVEAACASLMNLSSNDDNKVRGWLTFST
jgi:hypothetical protein